MSWADTGIEIGGEEIVGAVEYHQGIPHLQYDTVHLWVEANADPHDTRDFWSSIERTWLWKVGQALGGKYEIFQSDRVLLLGRMRRQWGAFAVGRVERALALVDALLPGVAEQSVPGKHMVLCLASEEDTARYVAGLGCGTDWDGLCVNREPVHVLIRAKEEMPELTLAHEMTHACLWHVDLPRWLGEGIAVRMERILGRAPYDEVLPEQLAAWRKLDLESFWSGEAFHADEATTKAAYRLADHLLNAICRPKTTRLAQFILNAKREDAGHASALEHLDCELEVFLDQLLNPPPPEPSPAARFFRKLFKRT